MSSENNLKKTQLVPISLDLTLNGNTENHENQTIIPIGGIIFDEGKQFVALGTDAEGKIVVRRLEGFPTPIDASHVTGGSGRILNLSGFSSIHILQTGLEPVMAQTHPSILAAPSVAIEFSNVEDCENIGNKNKFFREEDEILELFIGKRGGIVVFSGYDLPEDNALLFEQHIGDEQHATLLFIKPSGKDQAFADSVGGVYQLLKQLNDEFAHNASLPLQTQALAALDKAIQRGEIDFHHSDVRQQIFRTHVIALARLAIKTKDQKYIQQLEKELPHLHEEVGARIARLFGGSIIDVQVADTALAEVIKTPKASEVNQQARQSVDSPVALTPKDTAVYNTLHSKTAKDWWAYLAKDRSYRSNNDSSRKFVDELVNRIYYAKTKEDFDDTRTLIVALFDSEYKSVSACFDLHLGQDKGFITWYLGGYAKGVEEMRAGLIEKLDHFQNQSL